MPAKSPTGFTAAQQSRELRTVLRTNFTTAQLATIPAEIRERAFFSARVTLAEFLQTAHDGITEIARGIQPAPGEYMDLPTLRLKLKQLLSGMDYAPSDPRDVGTIKDLRTDARLNLIVDMGRRQAHGYGQFIQGQDPEVLDEFPCQELIRIMDRHAKRNWMSRWRSAGGRVFDGRMIARKDSPVWVGISTFGLPYPPFDFGSGMGVVDVSRSEAEELGVIERGEVVRPQDRAFNRDLSMTPDVRDQEIKDALMADVGHVAEWNDGVLSWKN